MIHPLPISTSDPDRTGVMHEVGGLGHVQAGSGEQQQHSGRNDGEQDVIHGRLNSRRESGLNA
jgi:hypothetical protein